MYKLGLLPLVRPVIQSATKIETFEQRSAFEYWALVAVVGRQQVKIKVILRRAIGGEKIYFWSVMMLDKKMKQKNLPRG